MKPLSLLVAALLVTASIPPADATGSMRCRSRVVDRGMLAAAVLGACGEPAYRDVWSETSPAGGGWLAPAEQWYYNFGPNQLLRVVTLKNGAVSSIDADGYGYAAPPDPHCAPGAITPGESKYRLLLACGEPVTRRALGLLRPLRDRPIFRPDLRAYGPDTQVIPVWHEEWVYNFGARYLMRVVTLENGRVVDVANGDRGFD